MSTNGGGSNSSSSSNNTLTQQQQTTVYASLNNLVNNGIVIDKNLRQPTYYSWINIDEFKSECFSIISDLLTNQKVPIWLSQRIAWYYANKHMQEIIGDLSVEVDRNDLHELKLFNREKMVVYLRKSISSIIKEWFNEKSKQNDQALMFSFARFENDFFKSLSYSEFGIKNKRRVMEDKISIFENIDLFNKSFQGSNEKTKKKPNALFAVFDGHCGVDCAQFVSTHLPLYIIQHPEYDVVMNTSHRNNLENVLKDSFKSVNQMFTLKAQEESIRSGSTCCLCILSAKEKYNMIDVAWCGDTQFCLVKNGKISFLTDEHKPNNLSEKQRIEETGATVSFVSNLWRINGSLAVSRSFGDIDYQPAVTCEPQLKHLDLDGSEDYFIIACDGFWESINTDDLCTFIYEQRSNTNQSMAELLVRKAQENGSSDNITVIFVLLKENITQITEPN